MIIMASLYKHQSTLEIIGERITDDHVIVLNFLHLLLIHC